MPAAQMQQQPLLTFHRSFWSVLKSHLFFRLLGNLGSSRVPVLESGNLSTQHFLPDLVKNTVLAPLSAYDMTAAVVAQELPTDVRMVEDLANLLGVM